MGVRLKEEKRGRGFEANMAPNLLDPLIREHSENASTTG